MQTEIWKEIPEKDFANIYEISNYGRMRNIKTKHILKPRKHNQGYQQYGLYCAGLKPIYRLAHVLVAKAFIPNPEQKRTVNHKDCDKQNNFVDNLEWMTHSENHTHAFKNGRENPNAFELGVNRLTKEEVRYARTHYIHGDPVFGIGPLARLFKISYPSMRKILRHESYKSIE